MNNLPWDFIAAIILCWIAAHFAGKDGFRGGYIQALEDMRQNKPAKYILKQQENGETKWEEDKEKK